MSMTLRSQYTVLLTGFSENDRQRLSSMITKLGGCYLESQMFSPSCTHLICGRMSRSEKFLGACATGCWILVPSYIDCCHAAKNWLPEEKFEWGPQWSHLIDDKCSDDLLLAPQRWRACLAETTPGSTVVKGAFDKWRVGLVVDNAKRRKVYKRLLEVGGASFVRLKLDDDVNTLTHVFVDPAWLDTLKQKLCNTDVLCSTPSYIGDYLLKTDTPVHETSQMSSANSSIFQSFISTPTTVNNHKSSSNSSFTGSPGKMTRQDTHRNITPPHRIIYSPSMTSVPSSAAVTPVKLSQSSTSSRTSNNSNKSRCRQTQLKDFFSPGKSSASMNIITPNEIHVSIDAKPDIDVNVAKKSKAFTFSLASAGQKVFEIQSPTSISMSNPPTFKSSHAKFSPRITRSKKTILTSPRSSSKQVTNNTDVDVKFKKLAKLKTTLTLLSELSKGISSDKISTCIDLTADKSVCVGDNKVSKSKATTPSMQSVLSKPVMCDRVPTCIDLTEDTPENDKRSRYTCVDLTNNTPVTGSPLVNRLITVKSEEKESHLINNCHRRLVNCMTTNIDRSPKEIRNINLRNNAVRKSPDNAVIDSPSDPCLVMPSRDNLTTVEKSITGLLEIRNEKTRKLYDQVSSQQSLLPCDGMDGIQHEFERDCDEINIEIAEDDVYVYKTSIVTNEKQNIADNPRTESPLLVKKSNDLNLEKHSRVKSSCDKSKNIVLSPGIATPTNVKRNLFALSPTDSKSKVDAVNDITDNGRNSSSIHVESTTPGSLPSENLPVKRKIFPDVSLDQATMRVKKRMKVNHEPYGVIADCMMGLKNFTKESLFSQSDDHAAVLAMSHTASSLIESCLEENTGARVTIDVIHQLMRSGYLQSHILHAVMTKLLLEALDDSEAQAAEHLLLSILLLHPPTFPAIQTAYLHSLRKPLDITSPRDIFFFASQCQEWAFIKSVLDACIIDESADNDHDSSLKQRNSLKLFAYLVKLLEIDFFCHLRSAKSEMYLRKTMLGQILWPTNQAAYNQKHVHHILDALLAINKQTFQLTTLLLKLLALIVEFLKVVDNSKVTSVIYELARRVTRLADSDGGFELNYLLSMIQPCWLALGVCDVLLNNMDNSLVTERISTAISMEKIVKVEMFKLPELVEVKEINTPSAKKRHSKTRYEYSKVASPQSDRKMKKLAAAVNRRNSKGETSLHLACMKNNINHVRELLAVPGIAVNIGDYAGWTALHEACNKGHVECVRELLLFKPAKTIQNYFGMEHDQASEHLDLLAANDEGITALHDAVQNNRVEVAELLHQYGGSRLLEAKTRTNIRAIDLVTSDSMRTTLSHASLDSTPLKGLPNFMNFSQGTEYDVVTRCQSMFSLVAFRELMRLSQVTESSSSSQGSPQPDLLPCEELYKQVLGGASGSKFASVDSCLRYMSLIRRTLQLYIQSNHLDAASNNDSDSEPIDDEDSKENATITTKQSTVNCNVLSDWNGSRRSSRTCKSVWRKSSDDIVNLTGETLLLDSSSVHARTVGTSVTDECNQRLKQDLIVYMNLHRYVRTFAGHITRISQQKDHETLLSNLELFTLLCPKK